MRSGITHRWLRGSLFLTVLLVLLVDRLGEQVRRVLDPWSAQE